jgi:predicted ATPase
MIHRIRIKDFKSIEDVELEFDAVTVLIGRSGNGKSNLVQAIRFLRNLLLDQAQAIQYEGGWPRIMPVGKENPRLSIEVLFSVPGEEKKYNYRIVFGLRRAHLGSPVAGMGLVEEQLALGEEEIFSRVRGQNLQWEWNTAPNISPGLPNGDSPALGAFPSLQQVIFANAALSTGIGYYHFPSTALTSIVSQQFNQTTNLLQKIPGFSDDASNYRNVIRGITQDFHNPSVRKNILASLKAVNSSIESVELDSIMEPTQAIISHKAGDRIFALSLEQESDGLRRFYAHLLALYQTPSKLTLVFEEPENAIFPGALSLLADEFKAAPRENRGQVILTTHNPTLLDSFDVENVRAVEMRDGKTVVGPVSQEQRQAVKDRLLSTGELLTVDTARMEDNPKLQPAK